MITWYRLSSRNMWSANPSWLYQLHQGGLGAVRSSYGANTDVTVVADVFQAARWSELGFFCSPSNDGRCGVRWVSMEL
jgi:hypothetical protein